MNKKILGLLSAAAVLFMTFAALPYEAKAQELSVDPGATITSRFIYRGLDLGSSPQVQPMVGFNYGNFNFSLWASHPLASTPDGDDYKEVKFWMNYTIDLDSFSITPQFENHFNANGDITEGDNYWWQASLRFAGKGDVAPDFLVGYAFSTADGAEDTIYLEAGVNFSVGNTGLRPFISGQYSDEGGFVDLGYEGDFVINQVGLGLSRSLKISDSISVPVGVLFAMNPKTERAFAAFSISF
ncbi:MAG: hypothetical protein LAT67_02070 [Balneolales bacterium]|nr:hypothetical protein [Balneolales bacterium]